MTTASPPSLARRRRRLVLAGAAALVALGGAIGLTAVSDRRASAARSAPLVDAPPTRIVIARPGFEDVVLSRDASSESPWRITAPCPLAASAGRVAPLLEALETVRLTRDAAEIDPIGAGLASPVATLEVDGVRIDVGGPDLGGARRYLRRGDSVGFAPEWLGALLGGGMTALAEPAVVRGAIATVDGDPDPARAAAWAALEAVQSVEWPIADVSGPAGRTLEIGFADGRTATLDIASTDAWHAIRIDGAACARIVGLDALPG